MDTPVVRYASSKTCSACGTKNEQMAREPVFWCADEQCGHRHDRDENAAVNLARWTALVENQEETLPLVAAA
ncbi:zinc ribbon domain-containing protein [Egicoccus halophilus]|nr:zinc ribbon domain-containing protein [Egicoccus halophilus]